MSVLALILPSLVRPKGHSIVREIQGFDRDLRSLSPPPGGRTVFRIIVAIVRLVVCLGWVLVRIIRIMELALISAI